MRILRNRAIGSRGDWVEHFGDEERGRLEFGTRLEDEES
jgi:hypothetical protein